MRESVRRRKEGFTLVELSLSIAFIAILSIIIVIIINNTISSYRRGLTLNKINSTGMDLVDDIRAAIQNSPGGALTSFCDRYYKESNDPSSSYQRCHKDGARNFVSVIRLANVEVAGRGKLNSVPVFGAFCTGSYSYIWNSGYFFSDDAKVEGAYTAQLKYSGQNGDEKMIGDGSNQSFRLLKVEDDERAICVSAVLGQSMDNYRVQTLNDKSANVINGGLNVFDITGYHSVQEEPIDILASDAESGLAIYDFWSQVPAESKSRYGLFYVASLTLGTLQGGVDITATGNFCATPNDYQTVENLDYCAINKFNIASQAMGK